MKRDLIDRLSTILLITHGTASTRQLPHFKYGWEPCMSVSLTQHIPANVPEPSNDVSLAAETLTRLLLLYLPIGWIQMKCGLIDEFFTVLLITRGTAATF